MDAVRPSSLRRWSMPAALAAASLLALAPAAAQQSSEEWLERCRRDRDRDDRVAHCEVRETRLAATGDLEVNARPNGGITVRGWDRDEVLVRARVRAQARTGEEARELASQVSVVTEGGRIRSEGPRWENWDRRGWTVSYEVFVPRRTDLDLTSVNGGLNVSEVEGELQLSTTNGGISLERVAGSVRGRTTNGALDVRLTGDRWNGSGLDLETTNGSVTLTIPEDYSARLETRTQNGGMSIDFPITLQGRIGKRIETNLGGGGAPIRVETTNGAIRIRRG
jgi:hypothetical protein